MCNVCKNTDCIISESFKTSTGREAFADLRIDLDNNQLDINYGLLEINGDQGKDTTWSQSLDINFCPICGRNLKINGGK